MKNSRENDDYGRKRNLAEDGRERKTGNNIILTKTHLKKKVQTGVGRSRTNLVRKKKERERKMENKYMKKPKKERKKGKKEQKRTRRTRKRSG